MYFERIESSNFELTAPISNIVIKRRHTWRRLIPAVDGFHVIHQLGRAVDDHQAFGTFISVLGRPKPVDTVHILHVVGQRLGTLEHHEALRAFEDMKRRRRRRTVRNGNGMIRAVEIRRSMKAGHGTSTEGGDGRAPRRRRGEHGCRHRHRGRMRKTAAVESVRVRGERLTGHWHRIRRILRVLRIWIGGETHVDAALRQLFLQLVHGRREGARRSGSWVRR